jgi:ubiquinone/menaquinone biosynthesis C-methylase UbiE
MKKASYEQVRQMHTREQVKRCAEEALKEIGITEGQTVLDCCCGSGNYSLPAAKLVGEKGLVHALDKDPGKLNDLRQKAESIGLQNIEIIEEDAESKIPLPDSSVDLVLLYDIFWYFKPTENKLTRLLKEVYRVTKPNALTSVYPTHLNQDGLKHLKEEMVSVGFYLESRYSGMLVHVGRLEQGELLNFKKAGNHQVKELEARIADLKARLPAHSIPPRMIEKLDELEEELERAKGKK